MNGAANGLANGAANDVSHDAANGVGAYQRAVPRPVGPDSGANGFDHDDPAFVVPSPMDHKPAAGAQQEDEQAAHAPRRGRR
jgi:hypothetical protein